MLSFQVKPSPGADRGCSTEAETASANPAAPHRVSAEPGGHRGWGKAAPQAEGRRGRQGVMAAPTHLGSVAARAEGLDTGLTGG